MKKFLLMCAIMLGAAGAASAQSFSNGAGVLNIGLGMGGYGLPLSLSYEHGVYDFNSKASIGVGGIVGFNLGEHHNYAFLGARGAFHYAFIEELDTYAGVTIATNLGHDNGGFWPGFHVGTRYFFNSNWAAFIEFGSGISYTTLGAAYKF